MYFACPYIKPHVLRKASIEFQDGEKEKPLQKTIPFRMVKLALMGMCLGTYIAAEFGFMTFGPSMLQYLPIQISASKAAQILSVLSVTFTVGRLITAVISLKVGIDIILAYHYVIQIFALIILYFGQANITMIYIGMATFGKFL